MILEFCWYLKPHLFHVFNLIFTFKTIYYLYDLIMSKEKSVDLMKKHGFYFFSFVF
jgi:hypothetical protein